MRTNRFQGPVWPRTAVSTGSIIRAGGQPLGTSVKLVIDTTRWLAKSSKNVPRVWPAAMSCPNLVLFGALPQPPPAALAEHPLAHKSGRFPGTAIKLKGATPEVFDSGKFIVHASSIKVIEETVDALATVIDVAEKSSRRLEPALCTKIKVHIPEVKH